MIIYLTCFVAGILIFSGNQRNEEMFFETDTHEIVYRAARQLWFNVSFTMWIYGAFGIIWTTVNSFT